MNYEEDKFDSEWCDKTWQKLIFEGTYDRTSLEKTEGRQQSGEPMGTSESPNS